jgi:hypothetical protein
MMLLLNFMKINARSFGSEFVGEACPDTSVDIKFSEYKKLQSGVVARTTTSYSLQLSFDKLKFLRSNNLLIILEVISSLKVSINTTPVISISQIKFHPQSNDSLQLTIDN